MESLDEMIARTGASLSMTSDEASNDDAKMREKTSEKMKISEARVKKSMEERDAKIPVDIEGEA